MWKKIEEIDKFKSLDFNLYRFLIENFGKRGDKAFFYVKEGRVKKYRDFFVVVGRNEYIVDEDFCICQDFQFNLKGKKPCAHIIAIHVASATGNLDEIDAHYIDFTDLRRRVRFFH